MVQDVEHRDPGHAAQAGHHGDTEPRLPEGHPHGQHRGRERVKIDIWV